MEKSSGANKPRAASAPIAVEAELDPLSYVRSRIRDVPDFPKPGILFKDITPVLADPRAFQIIIDRFAERFLADRIDAVVGVESRGFIFGAPLALRLNAAFVPVRKAGKLPYLTDKVAYSLEYGTAELEVHHGSFERGARVVLIDDLLATGGTALAAAELVRRQGAELVAYAFAIELDFLAGRQRLAPTPVVSLIRYAGE